MSDIYYLKYNHPTKLYLTEKLSNCHDMAQAGFNRSGIFNITLPEQSFTHVWVWVKLLLIELKFQVYCDLETDGGDWLVSVFILLYCIALLYII